MSCFPAIFDVKTIVMRVLVPALLTLVTQNDAGLSSALKDVVLDSFAVNMCDENGKNTGNIEVEKYPYSVAECSDYEKGEIYDNIPLQAYSEIAGEDHLYYFAYNSFGNNRDIVDELYDFIQMVKEETGHDKVNIVPISMGGSIANGLLEYYPDVVNDLNKVVYIVPALNGSTIVGDLYTKNFTFFDTEYLYNGFLETLMDEEDARMIEEEWQGKFRNGASDQYALAAIVYELLVGNIPFASAFAMGDILVAANAVMSVSPEIPDELPKSVRSALAKALAKRPEERFASCADFVAALEGNVKVESVRRVVPDAQGGVTRASRPVVIIALLALLGAGGGVWYLQDVKTRDLRRIVSEQKTALELKASEVRSLEKRVEEERIAREGVERKLSEQQAAIKETEEKLKQIKAEKKELVDKTAKEIDFRLGEARRKADEALEKERDRLVKKFAEQESSLTNRLMQLHADECSRLEAKSKSALERAQKAESALSELRAANAATGSGSYAAGGEASGPKHGDAKTLILPGGVTMEMIYCAPGEYVYGEDEKPSRIEQGFWLGKYEVTQRQWASVMGENGSYFKGEDLPVDTISWDDCQRFVAKINARLSCGARLPTEHEWEYACRAATKTEYSWGDALNGDKANCDGTYPVGTEEKGAYLKKTVSVDSYAPNPWGFHCMHGNVRVKKVLAT